jgi:hypothetical protein
MTQYARHISELRKDEIIDKMCAWHNKQLKTLTHKYYESKRKRKFKTQMEELAAIEMFLKTGDISIIRDYISVK